MYRYTNDFLYIDFVPANLLNMFIIYNWILIDTLEFSIYNIIFSVNRDHCTSFFPMWLLHFFLVSARAPSAVLNRSAKSWLPCLVPDSKGRASSLSPISPLLNLGFRYMTFIRLKKFPSIPSSLNVFIVKVYWILTLKISYIKKLGKLYEVSFLIICSFTSYRNCIFLKFYFILKWMLLFLLLLPATI